VRLASAVPVTAARLAAAGMVLGALALAAPPGGAQPATEVDAQVAALREQADAASQAYFDALGRAAALQAQITELEARLPKLAQERADLLEIVRRRAVAAYMRSGAQLAAIFGGDALDTARRTQWLEQLNARDDKAFANLGRATERLESERRELRAAEQAQQQVLAQLESQGHEIDAKLQAAENVQRELRTAATPPRQVAAAPAGAPAAGPPPDYQPTQGVHPQHDHPFLVCTRGHESGGNYQAYNPAGPYMGAYQFLQSTWNSTANHAGRPELIGVPPHTASAYDQDDMAWSLYQWQGSRPWGGRCG